MESDWLPVDMEDPLGLGSIFESFNDNEFKVYDDVYYVDDKLFSEALFDTNSTNGSESPFDELYNLHPNFNSTPDDQYNHFNIDPEIHYHSTDSVGYSHIEPQQFDIVPDDIPVIEINAHLPVSNPIQNVDCLSEFLVFHDLESNGQNQSPDASENNTIDCCSSLSIPPALSLTNTTDVEFENKLLLKPRKKRSYGMRTLEERKARKKEQNKKAAIIYRNKRKQELEDFVREEAGLLEKNSKLKKSVDELLSEMKYLKKYLRTMFIKKGLL